MAPLPHSMATSAADSAVPHPAASVSAPALRILNPPDGAIYLIDPTLRREFQTLSLRATAGRTTNIEWRVDGHGVGHTEPGGSIDWPLAVGRHVISAQDPQGHHTESAIIVK
jgi:membrane carboxypeptidase/penicillin-binding protein PbpC